MRPMSIDGGGFAWLIVPGAYSVSRMSRQPPRNGLHERDRLTLRSQLPAQAWLSCPARG